MSFLALGIREVGLTLRQRRAILAVIAGVLGLVIGIVGEANFAPGSKYEYFLLVISYWIATWLGVVLTDYWLTRGEYDERHFFETRYQRWQGVVAMAVALVVSVGLFSNYPQIYVGPVPKAYPAIGDITFIVGFAVSAGLYLLFNQLGARERLGVGATQTG
jgi:purine-cytosine permease-like protein